jgi:hypothetical protein
MSFEGAVKNSTQERRDAEVLFTIWLVLLLPWLLIAPFLGMAFDSPPTLSIYVGVWSVCTYPLSVGIVWMFRRKYPLITLFPCINLLAFLIGSFVP